MDNATRRLWRIFDGSVSVSASMLLAALLKAWTGAANLPGIGLLYQMTRWEDGVIIVATILLFPTTATLWGGSELFFLAKERVERRYKERGIKEGIPIGREEGIKIGREEGRKLGIQEGRRLERERIRQEEDRQLMIEEGRRLERERIRQEMQERGIDYNPE